MICKRVVFNRTVTTPHLFKAALVSIQIFM